MQNLLEHVRQLDRKLDREYREYAEAILEASFRANIEIIKELMGDESRKP